jgi:hypothetical protein
MDFKVIILIISFNLLNLSLLSQDKYKNESFELIWGTSSKSPGSLLEILPKQDQSFYSLRWSGGRAFGTYRIVDHEYLLQTNQSRIKQVAAAGIANFETAHYIGKQLYIFLSDKVDGALVLFAQPYTDDLKIDGPSVQIASYENPKINAKANFDILSAKNNAFFGVVWEIPGRKTISDSYGYVILDEQLNTIHKGDYKIPLNGNLTSINEYHISNNGDFFLGVTEHKRPNDKLFGKSYDNFKALHVYKIRDNELIEFSLVLENKRIDDISMSSNNQGDFILSGIYGNNDSDQNKRRHNVEGVFVIRIDTNIDSIIFKGFIPFRKDFVNMTFNNRGAFRSRRNKNRIQELYNYKIRDIFTLADGSLVGSMEQYYVSERSSYDSRTGLTSTIYYYYYDDIIAFKIGKKATFEWQKKINKSQVSTNDGGPFSSYSSFTDGKKLFFIFNDNLKNYNENGEFIKTDGDCYSFNLSRRKNVAAITEIGISSGIKKRTMLFARKDLKSIVVPKMFKLDPETNSVLLYALLGAKERFGILKFIK